MKTTKFRWRLALPLAAALTCDLSLAVAQQPVAAVDLIKPIEAAPLEAVPIEASRPESQIEESDSSQPSASEPTPAATRAPVELVAEG